MPPTRDLTLSVRSRLDQLVGISHSIQVAVLDPILTPYTDGRVIEGDVRSPALRQAIAGLLAAADRVGTQAKADLASLKAYEHAKQLNEDRHTRAEQGRQI